MESLGIDVGTSTVKVVLLRGGDILFQKIVESKGKPYEVLSEILQSVKEVFGDEFVFGITGSGATRLSKILSIKSILEDNAIFEAVRLLYPKTGSVVSMGHQGSRCIRFSHGKHGLRIDDSVLSPGCASGSGTFIEYLYQEMEYSSMDAFVEDAFTSQPADLAGRCAVFARSDMVHLRQVGVSKAMIAAGVCKAAARQLWTTVVRSRRLIGPALFIGGVSANRAVMRFAEKEIRHDREFVVPKENRIFEAIGAAFLADSILSVSTVLSLLSEEATKPFIYDPGEPLRNDLVFHLEPTKKSELPTEIEIASLGVDIGSVSTKAVLIGNVDGKMVTLAKHYGRTGGDPLYAVQRTLKEIVQQIETHSFHIGTVVAATTGSGRYLTGDFIGAEKVVNEISAQGAGAACCVSNQGRISVVEIGGQDSKYILLEDGQVIDFTMNKACAAGCGVFLEVIASILGIDIQELGAFALKGKRPPKVDTTCTVFTERSIQDSLLLGVSRENLAAAATKAAMENYFKSNVSADLLFDFVVFQGAVAKNGGMTAALTTALGRKVVVPAEPELTGAIGAASLALRDYERSGKTNFRGFETIINMSYEPSFFVCEACNNKCTIYSVEFGGRKSFYGDRCDRYSGKQKSLQGTDLPDLFTEYEKMLLASCQFNTNEKAPVIGIPRVLLFNSFGPLFVTFFSKLGFRVELSGVTNKELIALGQEACKAPGTCLPMKVAQGHVEELIQKKIDLIFLPRIISGITTGAYPRAQTCPFIQGAPDLIKSSQEIVQRGIRILSPTLDFQNVKTARGRKGLRNAFIKMARQFKKDGSNAFEAGMEALEKFQGDIRRRGDEILASLDRNKVAIVVASRPYSLYDPGVSMQIGKRIQSLGILAIPQDFLPLEEIEVSSDWKGMFSLQLQKRIHLAKYVADKPHLRVAILTHFGCGPDSFGNPFFADALGMPFCIIQIDEHTAAAGVMTRLEAFVDTLNYKPQAEKMNIRHYYEISPGLLGNRTILIPHANDTAAFLAAAMRVVGLKAEVLPRSPDKTMHLARRIIREDVCLPMLQVLQDILAYTEKPDFDPKASAFFMGNANGPCRFGMYQAMIRSALDKVGLTDSELVTLGMVGKAHGGQGMDFAITAWNALSVHDLLYKMLLHTRPYERESGEADKLFTSLSAKFIAHVLPNLYQRLNSGIVSALIGNSHLTETKSFLGTASRLFENLLPFDKPKRKPIVLLLGEFYVRLDNRDNNDIIRLLEAFGFEVWQAPATEFFAYANLIGGVLAKKRMTDSGFDLSDWKEGLGRDINTAIITKQERQLGKACLPYLEGLLDTDPMRIIENGEALIGRDFGGEAICTAGSAIEMIRRNIGVAGVVAVGPWGCIPSMIVQSVSDEIRLRHDNIPFLNLFFNGYEVDSETRTLEAFAYRVHEFYRDRI